MHEDDRPHWIEKAGLWISVFVFVVVLALVVHGIYLVIDRSW